jgi:hypothetical protein
MREEPHDELVRLAFLDELILDLIELLAVWKLEVVEEIDDFFERGVVGEVVDVVSDVGEPTFLAVDIRNSGLGSYDAFESLSGGSHRSNRAFLSPARGPVHSLEEEGYQLG